MKRSNREVLRARFPHVARWVEAGPAPGPVEELADTPARALRIAGIQLASAFDPAAEARLQASLVPEDAQRATLYGCAQGELARTLLARPALRALEVVLFHPGVCRASFERCDHADWLSDPRVTLARAEDKGEIARPFAASPACLRLSDDASLALRDLVCLELATPRIRAYVASRAAEMRARVRANRTRFGADEDVARLFGTRRGATVWVAAAGPSLAEHAERFATRAPDTLLVAVDGALRPLVELGARPDVVLAMDLDRRALKGMLAAEPRTLAGVTLVWDPVVHADVLADWPGERLAARMHPGHDPELGKARLWSSGSVLHPAVDLAVRAGASRVVLFGADFATPAGASHVRGFVWRKELVDRGDRGPFVLDGHGARVPSLPNLVGYLRDLERYIARHPSVRFVNASRAGARIAGTVYADELESV